MGITMSRQLLHVRRHSRLASRLGIAVAEGRTHWEFAAIMHIGVDLDGLYPNSSATATAHCFPAQQPFNRDLPQILKHMAILT
jgi:hypothetical protein